MTNEELFREFQRRKKKEKSRYFDLEGFPDFGEYYSMHNDRVLRFDARITGTENNGRQRIVVALYPFGRGNDLEPQKLEELRIPFDVLTSRSDGLTENYIFGKFGNNLRTLCEYSIIVDLNSREGRGVNYFIGKNNQKQKYFKAERLERLRRAAG